MRLIIITGMSGAGKTTVSKIFEDAGYYCLDNLPPSLLNNFVQICAESNGSFNKLAVTIDARGGKLLDDLSDAVETVRKAGVEVKVLFLDSKDETLIQRFSETRRRHPLNQGGRVADDIARERKLLEDIRRNADFIVDTSTFTSQQLKNKLRDFALHATGEKSMSVVFVSFGFKYGIPIDCDLVFDVRFLPNPFYVPELKKLTGVDKPVFDYVFSFKEAQDFSKRLKDFVDYLIPLYVNEPKVRLQIGIGCTGGRHRSVAFTEFLFRNIENSQIATSIIHRDVEMDRR